MKAALSLSSISSGVISARKALFIIGITARSALTAVREYIGVSFQLYSMRCSCPSSTPEAAHRSSALLLALSAAAFSSLALTARDYFEPPQGHDAVVKAPKVEF